MISKIKHHLKAKSKTRQVFKGWLRDFWSAHGLWRKVWVSLMVFAVLWTGVMYGIAQWYIHSKKDVPIEYGATFIPSYARYFDLDAQQTMDALIHDLGFRRFRLVSYWDKLEPQQGQFDFSELDWQFAKAEASKSKVSLAIGLRQPRWPECHTPPWAASMTKPEWSAHLKTFMQRVIERYKNSPSLESYQLENEYFMQVFGICPDFTRQRLIDEYNFVKRLDPSRPVIISRSNNWVGLPIGQPRPDEFAISVYKRVWDKAVTRRYYEYPLPAWFYGFLAGGAKILTGRDMIIHELQAEPWAPEGQELPTMSLEEQNKSMNADRLRNRFEYGRASGMTTIDLWGVEWWYWRKVHFNDYSIWNVAKDELKKTTR